MATSLRLNNSTAKPDTAAPHHHRPFVLVTNPSVSKKEEIQQWESFLTHFGIPFDSQEREDVADVHVRFGDEIFTKKHAALERWNEISPSATATTPSGSSVSKTLLGASSKTVGGTTTMEEEDATSVTSSCFSPTPWMADISERSRSLRRISASSSLPQCQEEECDDEEQDEESSEKEDCDDGGLDGTFQSHEAVHRRSRNRAHHEDDLASIASWELDSSIHQVSDDGSDDGSHVEDELEFYAGGACDGLGGLRGLLTDGETKPKALLSAPALMSDESNRWIDAQESANNEPPKVPIPMPPLIPVQRSNTPTFLGRKNQRNLLDMDDDEEEGTANHSMSSEESLLSSDILYDSSMHKQRPSICSYSPGISSSSGSGSGSSGLLPPDSFSTWTTQGTLHGSSHHQINQRKDQGSSSSLQYPLPWRLAQSKRDTSLSPFREKGTGTRCAPKMPRRLSGSSTAGDDDGDEFALDNNGSQHSLVLQHLQLREEDDETSYYDSWSNIDAQLGQISQGKWDEALNMTSRDEALNSPPRPTAQEEEYDEYELSLTDINDMSVALNDMPWGNLDTESIMDLTKSCPSFFSGGDPSLDDDDRASPLLSASDSSHMRLSPAKQSKMRPSSPTLVDTKAKATSPPKKPMRNVSADISDDSIDIASIVTTKAKDISPPKKPMRNVSADHSPDSADNDYTRRVTQKSASQRRAEFGRNSPIMSRRMSADSMPVAPIRMTSDHGSLENEEETPLEEKTLGYNVFAVPEAGPSKPSSDPVIACAFSEDKGEGVGVGEEATEEHHLHSWKGHADLAKSVKSAHTKLSQFRARRRASLTTDQQNSFRSISGLTAASDFIGTETAPTKDTHDSAAVLPPVAPQRQQSLSDDGLSDESHASAGLLVAPELLPTEDNGQEFSWSRNQTKNTVPRVVIPELKTQNEPASVVAATEDSPKVTAGVSQLCLSPGLETCRWKGSRRKSSGSVPSRGQRKNGRTFSWKALCRWSNKA